MRILLLLALFLVSSTAYGQDAYLELFRSDIKAQRVEIITESLGLTDAQAEIFWPLYREYELEFSKLGDERISIIKDFGANYDTMTDEIAKKLSERSFKLEEKRVKLRKSYYKKMDKKLPSTLVSRFFQIDNLLNQYIDIQITSELPLIE